MNPAHSDARPDARPWYERVRRWGQTNLTEVDPRDCDIDFWRAHWRKTGTQGIIVNAGGIVAYYPSANPMQARAKFLGSRDLFGEFVQAARDEGLAVLARMDVNRASATARSKHPDWFAVDADGNPFPAAGSQGETQYITCINAPYCKEHIPDILREIMLRYAPDGFTDNSWTGLPRNHVCHCDACREKFTRETGHPQLPPVKDWADPIYRDWIRWSYTCRTENWDLFNRVTQAAGGPDCLWLGMINANPINSHAAFCDLKQVAARSPILMCDHQSRDALNGFEQNSLNGALLHGLAGQDAAIPESMAGYARGVRTFRRNSMPAAELKHWMLEGTSGGLTPWWHCIGGVLEDRRMLAAQTEVLAWHRDNERYLFHRTPVAPVGLVWSQENIEFYGQDDVQERIALPWRGMALALRHARIPFIPVHADHIARDANQLSALVFPGMAALTDAQLAAIRAFAATGKGLLTSGLFARLDGDGQPRSAFPLGEVLGLEPSDGHLGVQGIPSAAWDSLEAHTGLRLPEAISDRHPIVAGFQDTCTLPFGGTLETMHPAPGAAWMKPVATFIPPFPVYPPEFSWMAEPRTDIAALYAGTRPDGGRNVHFAANVDACLARGRLPDHAGLLGQSLRWLLGERLPLCVEGDGELDCRLYRQVDADGTARLLLHLVNLTGCDGQPGSLSFVPPIGPLRVSLHRDLFEKDPSQGFREADAPVGSGNPAGVQTVEARVGGGTLSCTLSDGWIACVLDRLTDHELLVWETAP